MKKLRGKRIYITETQLRKLISKEIKRINEHADERKIVMQKIANRFSQIVINWCLIHYCTLTNTDVNQCKTHWKSELLTHLMTCASYNIKGNNSILSRYKAYFNAEKREEVLTTTDVILKRILPKFYQEKISIKHNDIIGQVVNDLLKEKTNILMLIAKGNNDEVLEYIESI